MKSKALNTIKLKLEKGVGKDFFGFLNHSKNYISAGLFERSMSIITVPIFTRLLVPADYGILSILASFISIFGIIYGLAIRGSITRYYYEQKNDFGQFLGSNIILLLIWSFFLSSLLLVFSKQLKTLFNVPQPIIYFGIVIVIFQVFFTLYESYLNAIRNSKKVARLTIFNRLLSILISIPLLILLTHDKYYGRAAAMLAMAAILGIYSLYKIYQLSTFKFNVEHIKYSLVFSIPIIFHFLSQYILNSFDLVMINNMVGRKETGLYSLAYSVGIFENMIVVGMLRAWTPEFYSKLNSKSYDDINQLASKFARLVYLSAFAIILFARELVVILADKKYHEALGIVPSIVISYVFFFLYTMYVNFAFYHKKTYMIAVVTIIAGAINIGLNYWLIPIYGYQVAGYTTLASYAALFIFHYLNVRYLVKPEWITKLSVLLPNFFILIFVVIIFSIMAPFIHNWFLLVLIKICFFAVLAAVYFGKDMAKKFYKK